MISKLASGLLAGVLSVISSLVLTATPTQAANLSQSTAVNQIFPDGNLAKNIASILGVSTTSRVTQTQLNSIKGVSTFKSTNTNTENAIASVEGVQYLNNIGTFSIEQGQNVTDLSPFAKVGTNGYKYLSDLNLAGNNITDITPLASAGMPVLTKLRLNENSNLVDISPLAKLTTIQDLSIESDQVNDISALANLKQLTALYAANNKITSISPLANATSLNVLLVENNNLSNIAAVANLTNLTSLSIIGERGLNNGYPGVVDISPLSKLVKLQTLYIKQNQISDVSPLNNLTSLTTLDASYNSIADLSGLSKLNLSQTGYSFAYQTVVNSKPLTYAGQQKAVLINPVKNQAGALIEPVNVPTWGTNYWNPENANLAMSDSGTYNNGNLEWPLGANWTDTVNPNTKPANNGMKVDKDVWFSWKPSDTVANAKFSGWLASPVKEYAASLSWQADQAITDKNLTLTNTTRTDAEQTNNQLQVPFYWSNQDPNQKQLLFKVTGGQNTATIKTTSAATGTATIFSNQLNIPVTDLRDGDTYTITTYNRINGQEYNINQIKLTLRAGGELGFKSAPTGLTTNEAELEVKPTDQSYNLQKATGANLVVADTRFNQQSWNLSMSYTPFKSVSDQLNGSILQYKQDGQNTVIDPNGSGTVIYNQANPLGTNTKDISADWNETNGPIVYIPANVGTKGQTYQSTVTWTLTNSI